MISFFFKAIRGLNLSFVAPWITGTVLTVQNGWNQGVAGTILSRDSSISGICCYFGAVLSFYMKF